MIKRFTRGNYSLHLLTSKHGEPFTFTVNVTYDLTSKGILQFSNTEHVYTVDRDARIVVCNRKEDGNIALYDLCNITKGWTW